MAKLYTFPNGLNDNRTSLFNTNSSTLERNSGSSGTGDGAPAPDTYQVEKGGDYIRTYGNPLTSDGMYMEFKQTIGLHYWMCSIFGAHKQQDPTDFNYSPLYDNIFKGVRFNWRKYDTGSSKHRYRLYKMGVVYRSSNSGTTLKDFGRDGSQNLFNFGTTGHSDGTCELTLSSGLSHVIGFYFQLETQGGGVGSTGGSWIKISDLQYIGTNNNREAILSPRTKYSTRTPATPRPIWTG